MIEFPQYIYIYIYICVYIYIHTSDYMYQKPTATEKAILNSLQSKYEGYLSKALHRVPDTIANQTASELQELQAMIFNDEDIRDLIDFAVSLYDLMEEHGIMHGRVKYPGPGTDFKQLVAKYDV